MNNTVSLATTPLHALYIELGARMVPFAGYDMPIQYRDGILKEHGQCRNAYALFDVSHMGQARLLGQGAAAALERLVPGDMVGLADGQMRYTQLTNEAGGILDDLIAVRRMDHLLLMVNAARREADFDRLSTMLGPRGTRLDILAD